MTGTLDAGSRGTYTDHSGTAWTYYQDSANASIVYVVPAPAFVQQGGAPQFHLTTYTDPQGGFFAGQCTIGVMLAVPSDVQAGVVAALQQKGVPSPQYQAMPFIDVSSGNQGGVDPNQAFLSYADAAGTVSRSVAASPSSSAGEQAVFTIGAMTEPEVAFLKAFFGAPAGGPSAGTVTVAYRLTAWARLPGIVAHIHFDSQAAYTYQRTFKWVTD